MPDKYTYILRFSFSEEIACKKTNQFIPRAEIFDSLQVRFGCWELKQVFRAIATKYEALNGCKQQFQQNVTISEASISNTKTERSKNSIYIWKSNHTYQMDGDMYSHVRHHRGL